MDIREVLSTLTANQKATLDYAREHGLSQFIRYGNNQFVGVNAERITYLQIESTAGQWSIGIIKPNNVTGTGVAK